MEEGGTLRRCETQAVHPLLQLRDGQRAPRGLRHRRGTAHRDTWARRRRRRGRWLRLLLGQGRVVHPPGHDVQGRVRVSPLACVALDLPAAGLGHGADLQQRDGVRRDAEIKGDRASDAGEDLARHVRTRARTMRTHPSSGPSPVPAAWTWDLAPFNLPSFDLDDDGQLLLAVDLDGKRRAAPPSERRMAPLDGRLDVLRVVVRPSDDDEVLQAPRHVQVAVHDEPEISRPEERPVAGVGETGLKCLLRLRGLSPVSLCDRRPRNPDFSYPIGRTSPASQRIDNGDLHAGSREPAGDHAATRGVRLGEPHVSVCQGLGVEVLDGRRGERDSAGDEQRGLREPVARIEGLASEPALAERGREPVQGLGTDRLGAVGGPPPAAEVEPPPLLGRDPRHAQLVSEVRTGARLHSILRYGAQPAKGTLQEIQRRHQHAGRSVPDRSQDPPMSPMS